MNISNSTAIVGEDQRVTRYSASALRLMDEFNRRVDGVYASVTKTPIWQTVICSDTPEHTLQACIREIFLSICWYQKHTTEAGFHMLGRLPKSEAGLMKSLMLHKIEEAEHGVWAHQDYEDLGGNIEIARDHPSAATFAVIGVWWQMAMVEEPYGYLGAEYLFEYLTAKVSQPVVEMFRRRNIRWKGARFIVEHATEDVKHTNLIRHLIGDTVTHCPDSADSMIRCFDYFHQVYPLPVWNEAYDRAMQSIAGNNGPS